MNTEYIITTVNAAQLVHVLLSVLSFMGLFSFVIGLWLILKKSPLIHHLWEKLIYKKPSSILDFDDWLLSRSPFFHKLWGCKWCQGFWCSVLLIGLAFANGLLGGWTTLLWIPGIYPPIMVAIIYFSKE